MTALPLSETLLLEAPFEELDRQFAGLMMRLSESTDPLLALSAALVTRATAHGHVCVDLRKAASLLPEQTGLSLPELASWAERLLASGVVGTPGDSMPLILDHRHRLYLYRYWRYEQVLVREILERTAEHDPALSHETLRGAFRKYFAAPRGSEMDWQKVGAFAAVTRRFSVISGGPGTGKSTLAGLILALLMHPEQGKVPRVALAAPTGKAASRLEEAMKVQAGRLGLAETLERSAAEKASTLHRLLGVHPGSPRPRHHGDNPLPADVVVVDEASMVDLALMSRLVQAVPPGSRLILLGDHHQLSSVEAGAVLGDLCRGASEPVYSKRFADSFRDLTGEDLSAKVRTESSSGMWDSVVRLKKNYRFGPESGIGALSRTVLEGDGEEALGLLKHGGYEEIGWRPLPPPGGLAAALRPVALSGYGPYLRARGPEEAFSLFGRFRILCALRSGPFGIETLTREVERLFSREGLIRTMRRWYRGRPVMVTRNDYTISLFNGDIGFVLSDPETGELRAFFQGKGNVPRRLSPSRLPEHETVFAMTVHKSQGSEFDEALLILPDRDSPILTRELIYTAVTRARRKVTVWGDEGIFVRAVKRRTLRSSGLAEALWGGQATPGESLTFTA